MKYKVIILWVSIFSLLASSAGADVNKGLSAYERNDYKTAYKEFKESAEQGDADAQLWLGYMYVDGEGVLQNYVQGHKWLNLSASQGNTKAKKARDLIAKKMTAEQIAEAQQLARAWRPTSPKEKPSVAPTRITDVSGEKPEKLTRGEILKIQKRLTQLGYDPGTADGAMGGKTRSAIQAYQNDAGLPVDGRASRALLAHVENADESARAEKRAFGRTPKTGSGSKEDQTQALVNSLKELAKEAETKRATDRWVLDRLWKLVGQYDWPWQRTLAVDDFSDGDFTDNPAWRVVAGNFFVHQRKGLSTSVGFPKPETEKKETQTEDLSKSIFGAILKQMAPEETEDSRSTKKDFAGIYLSLDMTNAFTIEMKMESQENKGRLEFGPYLGQDRSNGYLIAYNPGSESGLEFLRQSTTRSAVIDMYDKPLRLEDGKVHTILWTRDERGEMRVSVDGKEMFQVTDRRYVDRFKGFTVLNRGGDYTVRSITISGVK